MEVWQNDGLRSLGSLQRVFVKKEGLAGGRGGTPSALLHVGVRRTSRLGARASRIALSAGVMMMFRARSG